MQRTTENSRVQWHFQPVRRIVFNASLISGEECTVSQPGCQPQPKSDFMESAEIQLGVRTASEARPRRGRSAVTNGRRLHVVVPGDTKWSRRFRDILAEIISDMGGAGSGLSEAQRQLARRCATIAIACEKMEGEAAAGNEIDLVVYGMLTDRIGRCFSRLGLRRLARDVTPSWSDIAAEIAKEGDGA
jgi:hypothetical protein